MSTFSSDPSVGGIQTQPVSIVSPPVPAVQVATTVHIGAGKLGHGVFDYGNAEREGCQIIVLSSAAIAAGVLGIAALITEVVLALTVPEPPEYSPDYDPDCYNDHYNEDYIPFMGPGIGAGSYLVLQAIWGIVLLYCARREKIAARYAPAPAPITRNLLCNATTFTIFTGLSSVGLVCTGLFCTRYIPVSALLLAASVACFVASVFGCCATCKGGCGCFCCDYSPYQSSPNRRVDGHEPLSRGSFGECPPEPYDRSRRTLHDVSVHRKHESENPASQGSCGPATRGRSECEHPLVLDRVVSAQQQAPAGVPSGNELEEVPFSCHGERFGDVDPKQTVNFTTCGGMCAGHYGMDAGAKKWDL